MKQTNKQKPFQQSQQFGNIQSGPSLIVPNKTLAGIDLYNELGGQQMEMKFQPSNLLEIYVELNHKFQKPNPEQIRGKHIERSMEDLVYLLQNKGILADRPNIQFGSQVEERSGSETEWDSYYYHGEPGDNVMSVEGAEVTSQSIRTTAENFIQQLQKNNLL